MFSCITNPTKWFGTSYKERFTEVDAHDKWNNEHIDRNASNIRDALIGCRYIVEVEWKKIFVHGTTDSPYSWCLREEFARQYTYPYRELGDHCVVIEMRGIYDKDNIFVNNVFGGDNVYVGTNNGADATMIGLTYK